MKKLLSYIIAGVCDSTDFEIEEKSEDQRVILTINASPSLIGMIIGKEGKTIRAIRKIMSIKGTSENKFVNIVVNEKPN